MSRFPYKQSATSSQKLAPGLRVGDNHPSRDFNPYILRMTRVRVILSLDMWGRNALLLGLNINLPRPPSKL